MNFTLLKRKRCCECKQPTRPMNPLFKWSDHNDAGWVCGHCAAVWGYLDYIKL